MAIKVDSFESGGGNRRIGGTLAEINIIPLVDVTLVLLLIFMLTAPLMYRGIDVNLPKTSGKPTTVEERMVLTLSKEQTIYINDKLIPTGLARAGAARSVQEPPGQDALSAGGSGAAVRLRRRDHGPCAPLWHRKARDGDGADPGPMSACAKRPLRQTDEGRGHWLR